MPYVSEQGAKNILKYKYDGEDKSYVYRFILTPMNNWLISFVPLWMAPNLITTIGGLLILSAHLLTLWYSPSLDQVVPPWLSLYVAVCLFCYQTIDNLDGKQARRTQSSSPLGLLFDHGVDALNVTLITLTVGSVVQIGSSLRLVFFFLIAYLPFTFATWEEYYVGKLTLGVVNGPTDGLLLTVVFCLLNAAYPGIWSTPIKDTRLGQAVLPTQEHKLHVLILVAALFTLIPTVVSNAWSVSKKRPLLWTPLFTLLPFAVQVVFAVAWAKFSPAGILQLHPRLFIFGVGLIFCTNICKLMLAHLCALSYNPWRWSMAPFVIGALNGLLPRLFPGTPSPFDEETLFLVGIVWAFVSYAHFVFGVIRELTTILGIYCFTITRKQE